MAVTDSPTLSPTQSYDRWCYPDSRPSTPGSESDGGPSQRFSFPPTAGTAYPIPLELTQVGNGELLGYLGAYLDPQDLGSLARTCEGIHSVWDGGYINGRERLLIPAIVARMLRGSEGASPLFPRYDLGKELSVIERLIPILLEHPEFTTYLKRFIHRLKRLAYHSPEAALAQSESFLRKVCLLPDVQHRTLFWGAVLKALPHLASFDHRKCKDFFSLFHQMEDPAILKVVAFYKPQAEKSDSRGFAQTPTLFANRVFMMRLHEFLRGEIEDFDTLRIWLESEHPVSKQWMWHASCLLRGEGYEAEALWLTKWALDSVCTADALMGKSSETPYLFLMLEALPLDVAFPLYRRLRKKRAAEIESDPRLRSFFASSIGRFSRYAQFAIPSEEEA